MDAIHVPRPPKKAKNVDRPVNALLRSQVSHLQHAEFRLPARYQNEIYTHAIQTEGEAAEYIRTVTEAIHRAHADVEKRRAKRGLEIAAAAEKPKPKRKPKSKAKPRGKSKRGKKK
jgi:hypothetical protein